MHAIHIWKQSASRTLHSARLRLTVTFAGVEGRDGTEEKKQVKWFVEHVHNIPPAPTEFSSLGTLLKEDSV